VYIDDLLLLSATHEEHLEQLDALLSRLMQHGIKINLLKCEFGSKEVAYLGSQLTEFSILLEPTNFRPSGNLPCQPKSKKSDSFGAL
jgi:hypothetical protein